MRNGIAFILLCLSSSSTIPWDRSHSSICRLRPHRYVLKEIAYSRRERRRSKYGRRSNGGKIKITNDNKEAAGKDRRATSIGRMHFARCLVLSYQINWPKAVVSRLRDPFCSLAIHEADPLKFLKNSQVELLRHYHSSYPRKCTAWLRATTLSGSAFLSLKFLLTFISS